MARKIFSRYGIVVASVALATGVRLLLDPVLGHKFQFATGLMAVVVSAWYGGLWPGLASVILGGLATSFFLLEPREDFRIADPEERAGMALNLITGFSISLLAASMHTARRRAESNAASAIAAEMKLQETNLQLEARVAERAQELRDRSLMLDLAHDAIFVRDEEDRVTYWNDGAQRLYGWSKDEALGQSPHALLSTQFPQPLEEIKARLLADGVWRGELGHTRRDGALLTVSSSWSLLHNAADGRVSVVESNDNITPRKNAEREREKSNTLLSTIFRDSLDGMVVYEAVRDEAGALTDLRFLMINPAAAAMSGFAASELIGKRLLEKIPTSGSAELFEKISAAIEKDTNLDIEFLSRRTASPRWFRIAAVKLGDGLLATYSDITARKLADEKRQLLAARLGVATDILQAGIWEWDIRTNKGEWDDRMYAIYGLPQGTEIDFGVWEKAVAVEDLPRAKAQIDEAIARKSEGTMEFRIHFPDGSRRYIQTTFGPVLDDAGAVTRMIGVTTDITERKRTEERFHLVVEAAPNAMITAGPDGVITLVNSQAERLFGYTRGELVGRDIEILVPAESRAKHHGLVGRFFAEPAAPGKRVGRELMGLRKDGSEVPLEIVLIPIEGGDGPSVLVSMADITERRKVEERALLLTSVIEGAKDYGIFLLDPEGIILTWNEGAARIKGYSQGEIVGKHFSIFYPPAAIAAGKPDEELRIAREQGEFEDEGWRVRRDGSRFWATILITAVRDKQGNLRGYSKFTRDTTERFLSEERFQRVVEASPSALIIVDGAGSITLVNAQTEKLFGYERSELLGRRIEMLVPERFHPHHKGQRDTYFAAPEARAMGAGRDLFGVCKDGREVPVEIGLNPIVTAEGHFVLASIIDITERKRFEIELQTRAAEMERFTYTVSHDLKSPLITIKSYISMIDRDLAEGRPERTRSDLQRVTKAADKMGMLLEEVLALSRVGRVENTRETVEFAALVAEALEQVAGGIQQGNIQVEVADGLPSVTVDRARIVEVLQNLIDNASKFMENQKRPKITIGALQEGSETRFFVQDNGAGVDPKYHDRIFGLFDKLNPKSEGSGAGLAIVKRIIETHGGRIWVESAGNGGGSTFWFTLSPVGRAQ